MISDEVFNKHKTGLICLFSSGSYRPHELLQSHISSKDPHVLILDFNHRWSSLDLEPNSRIIRPKTLLEVIRIVQELPEYMHPRLDFIFVDDLPIYFRDYYGRDRLYTQNMRLFSYCLARFKKHSKQVPIFFTSYPNAFSPREPIYLDQTKYYTTGIIELQGEKSFPSYNSL